MPPVSRAALYYVPALDDELLRLGNAWLGHDPSTGGSLIQPKVPGIAEITAEPRHYGFHATLRAPMRLNCPLADFLSCAETIARATAAFAVPSLRLAAIDGFLALVTAQRCLPLQTLADRCVQQTEKLRAPASADELAKRRRAGLTARQEQYLRDWGYPYVLQDWQFHMTLTRTLSPAEMPLLRSAAERHFAPALALPRRCEDLCVLLETDGSRLFTMTRAALRCSTRAT